MTTSLLEVEAGTARAMATRPKRVRVERMLNLVGGWLVVGRWISGFSASFEVQDLRGCLVLMSF